MRLAVSPTLPMLSRHSAALSRTLSLLSRSPLRLPCRLRHHHRHAFPTPRPFHPTPLFLSYHSSAAGRRPPKSLHHHRHRRHMNTGASSPTCGAPNGVEGDGRGISRKSMNKARRESPEGILRRQLDMCSRRGDLVEALRLYDDALARNIPLSLHHYNVLLYLCSSPSPSASASHDDACLVAPAGEAAKVGLERGFEIFQRMGIDSIPPNEATFTSLARLAAAKEDPEVAFQLIEEMSRMGIPPRLRSYGPALFGFCKKGDTERAYQVESHMAQSGVLPEEGELAVLVQASVDAMKGDQVYRLLHRLRSTVRQVSESTADIVEAWFRSDSAARVGVEEWNVEKVKDGVVRGGGGWHGQGWLGTGQWCVGRTEVDESGICRMCGENLVSIDIDPTETENFANSLANLACQREVRADFNSFQEWLNKHGPFDAVIDGANVGLYNQQNFSIFQLKSVVNGIREMSLSKKMPLVVLHSRRLKCEAGGNPNNNRLLESWRRSGALYATPPGSNDDWYWLYAAVSCRSLLVTNDEMRDHLFELLGTSFFPRWKEKHQVRLHVSKRGLKFCMPPPYSIVIQEAEGGSWHVPTVVGDDIETPRQWLCATRATRLSSAVSCSRATA